MNYSRIKVIKTFVSQIICLRQAPLSACIFIGPSISLARKIDPFRMSEFISHKAKISITCGCQSDQAYHFMQCNSSVNHYVARLFVHREIHLLINKPEDNSLIANQGLVMAFGIANGLFVSAFVCKFIP